MKFHKDGTLPTSGEIFVFGSNLGGIHGSGAARVAREQFGAQYLVGVGPTGMAYAIPTKNEDVTSSLPLFTIKRYVAQFIEYANLCEWRGDEREQYFITAIGCGLAGYSHEQIAPMFAGAPDNCSFPDTWAPYLAPVQRFPYFGDGHQHMTQPTSKEMVLNQLRKVGWSGGLGYEAHAAIDAAITFIESATDEIERLRAQVVRDDEHYQAAMAMSEKHRKEVVRLQQERASHEPCARCVKLEDAVTARRDESLIDWHERVSHVRRELGLTVRGSLEDRAAIPPSVDQDGERYRFLRQPGNAIVYAMNPNGWGIGIHSHVRYDTPEQLDAAIDRARATLTKRDDHE